MRHAMMAIFAMWTAAALAAPAGSAQTSRADAGQTVRCSLRAYHADKRRLAGLVAVASDEPVGADGPPSLVVDVSPLGSVMSVDINDPSGSHAVDVAMLDAAVTQRFIPARRHCENVPDRVIVPIWFSSRSIPSATSVPKP